MAAERASYASPPVAAGGTVTLVRGRDVLHVRRRAATSTPGGTQGLFVLDARLLSGFTLLVNGVAPEPLAAAGRSTRTGPPSSPASATGLVVERHRHVGDGLRDEIVVRNVGGEAAYVEVERARRRRLRLAGPRPQRPRRRPPTSPPRSTATTLVFAQRRGRARRARRGRRRRPPSVGRRRRPDRRSRRSCRAGGAWRLAVEVVAARRRRRARARTARATGRPSGWRRWRRGLPQVHTDHAGLAAVVARCADDLGALRVFDPEVPERAVVAAGVPWAMALHGRDALLTAWMALLVDPDLAIGVLETLARLQGSDDDPRTEEEPGRILHQLPFGGGPADATAPSTPRRCS